MCLSGFSPILAYGLAQLNGKSGLAGWQWIWLVEGIITAGLGLIAYPCKLLILSCDYGT